MFTELLLLKKSFRSVVVLLKYVRSTATVISTKYFGWSACQLMRADFGATTKSLNELFARMGIAESYGERNAN